MTAMTTRQTPFGWRAIVVPVFIPTVLFGVAEGAVLPVIPALAADVGATLVAAGFIAAMIMVGELAGTLPTGWLLSRISERSAMIGAAALTAVSSAVALLGADPIWLAVGLGGIGLGAAVFQLARHAYMTVAVPLRVRARALSTLGGSMRVGLLIGPFLAAALLGLGANAHAALMITIATAVVIIVILLASPDPEASMRAPRPAVVGGPKRPGVLATAVADRRVFATVGVGAAILSGMRAARQVVLPLWAAWAGIDPALTAFLIGIGATIDATLFFLGGWIMDRFGRKWTAVPALIGLGLGNALLAAGSTQANALSWFVAATVLLAVANGLSSGVLMTLGSDLADQTHPAAFLAVWRLECAIGSATAPLGVAVIAGVASIGLAVAVNAAIGLIGAAILWTSAPDHRRAESRS